MRVTFDISKLASDWASQRRTGIGRVVEHLAVELSAAPECDLTFSCLVASFVRHARKGARTHPHLASTPLPLALHRRALYAAGERTRSTLSRAPRVARRAFSPAERLLVCADAIWGMAAYPIDPRALAQTQVFHSPMHPLPAMKIKNAPQRFLTIYDLIPLRYPEHFQVENSAAVQALMRGIVESATPEDWVICPSHATLADLCDYRGREIERAVVIPLAADPLLFHDRSSEEEVRAARRKYDIPDGAYFLSVCKLEPRKNVAHKVRAFLQMVCQERLSDVTLVIAGTPAWGMEEITRAVESCPDPQYRDRVLFIGHVEDEDLAALYRGATAFLYLSVTEGFGLPPLEAMQCGTPVIVSDCSSLPEVVGEAGVLLSPRDVDGLAQTLLNLYNSSSLRRQYSDKSLTRAKLFSWQRCAQETVAAYHLALGKDS